MIVSKKPAFIRPMISGRNLIPPLDTLENFLETREIVKNAETQ
jgi:hypothetical protein